MKQPRTTISQYDIALRCGVHQSTVSLALRRDPRVPMETIKRILAVATEMGYDISHNTPARRLALQRYGREMLNHVVAILVRPGFVQYRYHATLFSGVVDALTQEGFALVVAYLPQPWQVARVTPLPSIFARGDIDAVIVSGPGALYGSPAQQKDHLLGIANLPYISMLYQGTGVSSVIADDRQGAYLSARHLLELGHRHLLQLCTTPDQIANPLLAIRYEGICQAFTEVRLNPREHVTFFTISPDWLNPNWLPVAANSEEASLAAHLREHPEITAVLGHNDASAIHAWRQLNQAGFRLPDEISIVGYDDVDPLQDEHGQNIMTSVRLPLYEIGRESARLAMLHGTDHATPPETIVLATSLTIRASTAPAILR